MKCFIEHKASGGNFPTAHSFLHGGGKNLHDVFGNACPPLME
jgi:hypothetical protein